MHRFDPEWSIKNIIKLEKRKSEIDSHSLPKLALCEQQQQQQNIQQNDNNEKNEA
jgi:hypothetical protein